MSSCSELFFTMITSTCWVSHCCRTSLSGHCCCTNLAINAPNVELIFFCFIDKCFTENIVNKPVGSTALYLNFLLCVVEVYGSTLIYPIIVDFKMKDSVDIS